MEEATKRKALLSIDAVKDAEGRFSCKAVGITMGVSKARASVIIRQLVEQGYCLKSASRDYALLDKAYREIESLRRQAADMMARFSWLEARLRKEVVSLILSQGSDDLISAIGKVQNEGF